MQDLSPERSELWQRLFGTASPKLLKSFRAFHEANPHVYQAFKQKAHEAKAAGVEKTSHWLIMNVLRWESGLQTSGKEWRISNDHISIYARLLIWNEPEFEGFFDLHQMKRDRNCPMNTEAERMAA